MIQPSFEIAIDFAGGLAPVKIGNKFGYSDPTGSIAIAPRFNGALSFSEELAQVSLSEGWRYIDTTGIFVLKPAYQLAKGFSVRVDSSENKSQMGLYQQTGRDHHSVPI